MLTKTHVPISIACGLLASSCYRVLDLHMGTMALGIIVFIAGISADDGPRFMMVVLGLAMMAAA